MDKKFIHLVAEHEGILYKVSRTYCQSEEDRKDLFQDMLLQLWRSYPNYRKEAKFTTWMYRIALNTAITWVRKQKQIFVPLDEKSFQVASSDALLEDKVDLQKAISKLKEIDKAIIMLFLDDCSYEEIAEIVGISLSNVGYKLHEIKKKLKKIINP